MRLVQFIVIMLVAIFFLGLSVYRGSEGHHLESGVSLSIFVGLTAHARLALVERG